MTWKLDCGKYTLFVIEDGYYWRDPKTYYAEATEHDWRFHPRNEARQVRLNFGCYLITDGDRTVMVDAGMGEPPSTAPPGFVTGLMPEAVDALGVARDSVETVIYSHMHYDHIGGSRDSEGNPIFPLANHVFHTKEWDHWSTLDSDAGQATRRVIQPYVDNDRIELLSGDTEILPGITAVESFGHTPGHLTVSIMSSGTRTLIGGDVSNHPFQVEHPHWSLPVDNDPVMAGKTRDRVFEEIRDTGTTFLGGHYPMPGIGKIVTDDGIRVYQPGGAPTVGS
jgi:glyoxylase-like metal-dependent hydrolase (beta-lactamase superfamily II)